MDPFEVELHGIQQRNDADQLPTVLSQGIQFVLGERLVYFLADDPVFPALSLVDEDRRLLRLRTLRLCRLRNLRRGCFGNSL